MRTMIGLRALEQKPPEGGLKVNPLRVPRRKRLGKRKASKLSAGRPDEENSFMTLIKICGITNLADARAAVSASADMLGFNFYRRSPRFIEPQGAGAIIKSLREADAAQNVRMVGVFVNESAAAVAHIADRMETSRLNSAST